MSSALQVATAPQATAPSAATLNEAERRFLTPTADVLEGEKGWMVVLDLPGVPKKAVNLSVDNGVLTIRAERGDDSGYLRSFGLPKEVDVSKVSAKHDLGVLTVRLPKAKAAKPHKIAVK